MPKPDLVKKIKEGEALCHIHGEPVEKFLDNETGDYYWDKSCPRSYTDEELLKMQAVADWKRSQPRPRWVWFSDKNEYIHEKESWLNFRQPSMWSPARVRNRCNCGKRVVKHTILCADCWEHRKKLREKYGDPR